MVFNSVIRLVWSKIVKATKNKSFYPLLYRSYYHSFQKPKNIDFSAVYFSAMPNPGAGIGHQMANWLAGYWWAKQFKLNYAYSKFPDVLWDEFLGFGNSEVSVGKLKMQGYKRVRLPFFNENIQSQLSTIKKIIESYSGKKIVFVAEQDQFYKEQFGIREVMQRKFFSAPSRENDKLKFNSNTYNIVMHIRRGDIMQISNEPNTNPELLKRYQSNEYFINVLYGILENIYTQKPVHVYIFSQGKPSEFTEFSSIVNLHLCLDMNERDSFLHMVFADVLITSKSSFSYNPALLNQGIKVCPKNFWHGYPESNDFILADEHGNLLIKKDKPMIS